MAVVLARFKKSTRSFADHDCVEVATGATAVAVRDSKDKRGPVLLYDPQSWRQFIGAVHAGTFDRPAAG